MAKRAAVRTEVGSYERVVDALFHLTKFMNGQMPLLDLLPEVAKAAVDLVAGESASIALLDRNGRYLLNKASVGLPKKEAEVSFAMGEGIVGWVAEHGQPLMVPDVAADRRYRRVAGPTPRQRSLLCVPLVTQEGLLGVMTVGKAAARGFTAKDLELLQYLASSLVKDLDNARLYRLAITDPLTGAFNRQYLAQTLPHEVERSRRYTQPYSVIALDIDHFKRINDTMGHDAGDEVLRELTERVKKQIREVDAVVRTGGEEFLVLCPNTAFGGAMELAERLRAAVQASAFNVAGRRVPVTLSLGVAAFDARRDGSESEFLKRADVMLYRAKNLGRNRVIGDGDDAGMVQLTAAV